MSKSDAFLVTCPHCEGTGKTPHRCGSHDKTVHTFNSRRSGDGSSESTRIVVCSVCGRLAMVRLQYDPGTGCDDIRLDPGETDSGYSFSVKEAGQYKELAAKILLGKAEATADRGAFNHGGRG